ncbi:MAG: dephospho-CoA kinase [Clostridium sp.]|nr:dephospho-CoA kinase [Clostridium sp.]
MKLRIGITGGIGSGKTYVSDLFARRGIPIYNCDTEAARLMRTDGQVRAAIAALLGPDIYLPDGSLDKSRLAAWLFASPDHARQINAIVHPAVKRDFVQWAGRQTAAVVGMESAILFEAGMEALVDRVLLVDAPRELRLQRAIRRDGSTRSKVEARMNCQMDDGERRRRAHDILCNDGHTDVEAAVDRLLAAWHEGSACPDHAL